MCIKIKKGGCRLRVFPFRVSIHHLSPGSLSLSPISLSPFLQTKHQRRRWQVNAVVSVQLPPGSGKLGQQRVGCLGKISNANAYPPPRSDLGVRFDSLPFNAPANSRDLRDSSCINLPHPLGSWNGCR